MTRLKRLVPVFLALFYTAQTASGVELFGKGSVSKNSLSSDKSTISVSLTSGLAISLTTGVRIEGRYTNISALQNKMDVVSTSVIGTLTNIMTQTAIYSVGIDIDLAGERSALQPFIYLGGGYIETQRSYYFTAAAATDATYYSEPRQTGLSANGGLGIRLRLGKSLALEIEAFAYAMDIQSPNPLINLYGTAGIRLYV